MTRESIEAGSPLERLADRLGMEISYRDANWQECRIGQDTVVALAQARGYAADHEDAIAKSLETLAQEPWSRLLGPVAIVSDGDPVSVALVLPEQMPDESLTWRIRCEDGDIKEGRFTPDSLPVEESREIRGEKRVRRRLDTGITPSPGYHRLEISGAGQDGAQTLICSPRCCFLPEDRRQSWGIAVQLYALRSKTNWGIGDFSDLERFAENSARQGVSMIGINPLHALHSEHGGDSPYFPSNRLFLNVLYLDVEAVPEFAACHEAQAFVQSPEFQARVQFLRYGPLVDHDAVAEAKLPVLEELYACFRATYPANSTSDRALAFRRYREDAGPDLVHYATFEALSEYFGRETPWQEWPEEYRSPDAPGVAAFADSHGNRIEFFQFLQWEADRQLRRIAGGCERAGMRVGLYGDIALGTAAHGSEAWSVQESLCFGVHVGAPPDAFNQLGQDWGFPPLDPHALRRQAYAPFISMLRASMHHCGAIRLDHVMSLARLFWIPPGKTPVEGAYVRYPLDDLLAIVRLESTRNRCIIVGEDLGTVPENFRDDLAASGVLSYRVLYFERSSDGGFLEPGNYPAQALATVSTHDLPTLAGFLSGRDIEEKTRLRLFASPETGDAARRDRETDRNKLIEFLTRHGGLPSQALDTLEMKTLAGSVVAALAQTPCLLVALQIEDLLGIEEQANMPGTIDEHPNWRRKLPMDVDAVFAAPVFDRLRKIIAGNAAK